MWIAEKYRENARQCRELARSMPTAEQREQLIHMATQWEAMADERRAAVEADSQRDDDSVH